MYQAQTHDVRVTAVPEFMEKESSHEQGRYFWAYTIEIINLSQKTIQLMTANHLPGGKDLSEMSISLFSEANYSGIGFGLIRLSARFIPHLVVVSCVNSPKIGVCQTRAKPCHLYPSKTPQLMSATLPIRFGFPVAQRSPHGPPKSCRTR